MRCDQGFEAEVLFALLGDELHREQAAQALPVDQQLDALGLDGDVEHEVRESEEVVAVGDIQPLEDLGRDVLQVVVQQLLASGAVQEEFVGQPLWLRAGESEV